MIKEKSIHNIEKKEDRRTKYTKMVLTESLLELMQDKEIGKVTVSEICRKADINRNTFYKYYYGPENLLKTIEERFLEIVTSSLCMKDDMEKTGKDLLKIIIDNKELSRVMLSENGNQDFMKQILQVSRKTYLREWMQQVKPEKAGMVEKMYQFGVGGMIAVITDWVRNDFKEDIDEIAAFFKLTNSLIMQEIARNS